MKQLTDGKKTETRGVEEIAQEIENLSTAVQAILNGRLNERAIIILIQHAAHQGVSQQQIKAVLHAARDLKSVYLKK